MLAAREVVVSGGTVNSPHLLQISGIGPAAHLQSIGVAVVHDLPGVGANLSDHFAVRITHRVKDEVSINQMARGLRLVARDRAVCRDRARRADLRRHDRDGVLPQPRGAGEPGPAIAVYARELRPERHRPARARAGHDARRVPCPAGQPRDDHGAIGRSARAAGDPPELPVGGERRAGSARRDPPCPADLRRPAAGSAQRGRDCAGSRYSNRTRR